jgi:hypothetical protein
VCQQALLNRMEPIFEPIFDDAASAIGEGDRLRTHCAKYGRRSKAGRSGSWTRIFEISWIHLHNAPLFMK